MNFYYLILKNGEKLVGVDYKLDDDTVYLTMYDRKSYPFNKNEVEKIIHSYRNFNNELIEKVVFSMKSINFFEKKYDNDTLNKVKNEAIKRALNNPRNYMFILEYNHNNDVYLVISKKNNEKLFAVKNQFDNMNKKEIECFIAEQYINECIKYL